MFLWWIPWLLRSWAFFVGILIIHPVADTTDIARRNVTLKEFNELFENGFSDSRNIRTVNKKSELSSNMVSYSSLFSEANKNKKFAEVSSEFELTRLHIDDNADVSADAQAKYIENEPSNFALVNFELNNQPHLISNLGVNEKKINIANFKRITKRLNNNPSLLWRIIATNSVAKHNIISKTGNKFSNNSRSSSNRPWHFTNVDENLSRPFKIFINNSKSHDNTRVNPHQNILQEQTSSRKYSKENLTSEKYKFHGRRLINHEFKKGNANSKNMITNDFLNMPDISSRSINSNKFKRKKSDSKTSYVSQSSKIFLENKNFTKSDKSVLSNKSNINSVIISVCEDKCFNLLKNNANVNSSLLKKYKLLKSIHASKQTNSRPSISDLNSNKPFTVNNKLLLQYNRATLPQELKGITGNGIINSVNELNLSGSKAILLSGKGRRESDYFDLGKGPSNARMEVKRSEVDPQKETEKGAAAGENTGRLEIRAATGNSGRHTLFLRCGRDCSISSKYVNIRNEKLNFETINGVRLTTNKGNFVKKLFFVSLPWRLNNVNKPQLSISSQISSGFTDISKNSSTKINISNVSFDAKHISTTKSSAEIDISQSHVKANSVEALNRVLIGSQESSTYQMVQLKRLKKRSVNNDHLAVNPSSTKSVSLKNRIAGNSGTLNLSKKPKNISIEEAGMGGSALQPPVSSSNAQRFATQPAPQTAVIGSTAVLPCRVTGKVGHLQWTKDGFGLGTDRDLYGFSRYSMIGSDDEGDFSLRMNPVLLDDDALYQCQVSASDGVPGIRSQPVRLTVYVPPDPPVVEPTVLNTTSGMAVELQCQSKGGRPPPEIQWVDDSKRETILNGATDSVQMMEDGKRTVVTSKMTFTPRRHHNNQTVTCLTSNQALSSPLIASISLHVFFPPEVTLSSHPEQFIEGDDATFYCDTVANPPRVTFRWFHNAQELVNETSRELKISRISRVYHQDSISCEVSNKVGLSKKSQTMYVRFGPTFRTKPQDVMAEDGSNADLSCDVESNPTASISWLRDGSEKIIGSGASLRVQVSRSTAGIYKCVASVRGRDVEFPNLEGKVRVLVKGPPQIVSASEQQGRMGDTVSLECRTVSVPSPIRVTWTYKGRKIDLNDPRYDVLQDEGKGNHRNVLVIHDADSTDFGDYNCSVVNEYGVARKLIRLKEEKRVPVLLVVGCGASVVVVAVVIVSLVFCNKRHPSNKGQCEAVKDNKPNVTDPNQTPIANMYSAPSETKLDEGPLSSFPSPFTEVKVSPMPTNSVSYSMRPLNGDTRTNATNAEDFERDYTTFIETAAEVRGRRRSSLTDSSIYPLPGMGGTNPSGMAITSPPEFCTIRRTPRTQSPPVISTYPNGNVGIGLNHRSVNNGSIQLCSNRHSAYINSSIGHNPTSYSPPPPPPYPRNLSSIPLDGGGGITSPPKGSILVDNSGNLMTSNQEAKYIFSPEAMLKPGTLV